MLNVVAIMGRLVADPELRTTTSGINMARFRIACDRNFARQGEQRQADFLDVVAWRSQADFVCKYFQKGSLIVIDGSIQTRQYQDKNGNNRTAVEIVANNINFAGPKNSSGSTGGGASYGSQPRQNAQPAARPSNIEAVPATRQGILMTLPSSTTATICRSKASNPTQKFKQEVNQQWLLRKTKAPAPHVPCAAAARRSAASASIALTRSITRMLPVCASMSLSGPRSFPAASLAPALIISVP